jgi:F0F1-type ATP synthase assembly protein I
VTGNARRIEDQPEQLEESRGQLEEPMAVGYGVIGAVLGLGGLGFAMDRWLRTFPWLFLAGLVVGLTTWFVALGTVIKRDQPTQ